MTYQAFGYERIKIRMSFIATKIAQNSTIASPFNCNNYYFKPTTSKVPPSNDKTIKKTPTKLK